MLLGDLNTSITFLGNLFMTTKLLRKSIKLCSYQRNGLINLSNLIDKFTVFNFIWYIRSSLMTTISNNVLVLTIFSAIPIHGIRHFCNLVFFFRISLFQILETGSLSTHWFGWPLPCYKYCIPTSTNKH